MLKRAILAAFLTTTVCLAQTKPAAPPAAPAPAAPAPKPAPAVVAPAAPAPATAAKPATAPVAAATTGPSISPQAKAELEKIQAAYGKLQSLDLAGKLNLEFEIQGEKNSKSSDLTGSFVSPNKFKYQVKDDVLVGSTGEKLYGYKEEENEYTLVDAPKDRAAASALPAPFGRLLETQNPSISLALAPDAAAELTHTFSSAEQLPDVKVEDKTFTALKLTDATAASMLVLVDPATHLLRRVTLDMKPSLDAKGAIDVKFASLTVDYTKTTANAQLAADQFAWVPPEGATEAQVAGAEGSNPADVLVGKAAPDFKLKGADDKEVSVASQKGSVVILDFWATWCGPCREGLPHIDKIYTDLKDKGVKAFAVNCKEDKDTVTAFMKEQKLTIPPLLDTEGSVAEQYKVEGIPQTVVIGKDGLVKKIFVGTGPTTADDIRAAVEDAMK